jgi:predicted aldo/keto reductase-like oxidoreductase
MEKRAFGSTGEKLSIVGFGGILVMNETAETSSRLVSQAVDRGINYFDVAPSYGNAEQMLGPALEPHRKKVFLACKTGKRTAAEAQQELDQSLKTLRTDHFDLYQLHGVTTLDEVAQIFAPGGAIETFEKAKKKGQVRYIGFSAHSEEAASALMDRYSFTSILFPFNWAVWLKGGFGPATMAKATEKGVARLALKMMAKRAWDEGEQKAWPKAWYSPVDTYEEAELAIRFTLTKAITAAVTPGHEKFLWWACDAAEKLKPLTPAEEEALKKKAASLKLIFSKAA